MSLSSSALQARREDLLRQSELRRQTLSEQLSALEGSLDGLDRTLRLVGGGFALLGGLRRVRTTRRLVTQFVNRFR